ncbi:MULTISPECIES: sensor histidine kinase [Streptomycetaceae]|uniref:histidine kinase n=1 Tax=Streptantibioticus cattleyicolor (strain ATCC 35852 / DSM 46488 / JCM 4925 / NBRC 14057 / NRRL 8057) TaxID=1003195 RepID=F8K0Z1_STREN|nr:sensor histidine kinase [Streptantibioticus cattleyicolor]AEW93660.1 two-component system sensor kinase [Streptantibioticus cattleyicolor NRRL 8057 = DSM 46488]MYS58363.1 two-component sensor histidine kinase [Streptomyces sp. SID5468]CCB74011.1 Two-component system sensor kinase [Streptantibioticus cattleyicolor NRRL 8057 = DSM 46488]
MSSLDRFRDRLRARPLTLDAVVAVLVLAAIVTGPLARPGGGHRLPDALGAGCAVAACAALTVRRRLPRTVLAATCLITAGYTVAAPLATTPLVITVVVAVFTVASRTDRSTTWRLGAATCLGMTAVVMSYGPGPWYAQEHFGVLAWTGLAAAVGDAVRSRRAIVAAMEERAVRAERTREEEARRRVAEERMRIARELHDVVAHHIALVNVEAGVAAHVMESRPDQARAALAHVRQASRSALDELRATVGLLRQAGDPEAPREPAPRLAALDDLLAGFARAGLHADLVREGEAAGPLPAAVELTAYRVVQESLTNVHKHAGPGARAQVRLVRTPGRLEITVEDDGRGPAGDPVAGGGHGLIGMRERAAALGGVCRAGPRPEGGFRVFVTLPSAAAGPAAGEEGR